MISTIAKLLRLPSIDSVPAARGELLARHHLVREDDVKDVVVQLRSEYDALRKQHRIEMLAFGERVRRECSRVVVAIGPGPLTATYDNAIDEAVDAVDAVDVARLLGK